MHKPKILIALFRLPYPATDGTRYKILNNLAAGLVRDYIIEFFVVNIKKYQPEDVEYLEQHFGRVHLFHHSKLVFAWNSLKALWNGLPLQAQGFRFPDAQAWLDAHIDDYDAVYVHEIRMTELFIRYDESRKKKFLVDFNDAISMNYRTGIQKMIFLKKIFYRWEGSRVAQYETKVLESFKHFNIVSHVDRNYLLEGVQNKEVDFSVIHHGAPLTDRAAVSDENKIFFMGSLDYEPNRDGLTYFLETIWPKVRQHLPDLELIVVGGGHIPESFKKISRVSFLGFVPVVFDVIQHCKALIAPIRFAGGTPSKIVEVMGYGMAVITTPDGMAGIAGAVTGKNVVTVSENDIQGWVAMIERVITDNNFRNELGKNARILIEQEYSSTMAQEAFRNRFKEILDK